MSDPIQPHQVMSRGFPWLPVIAAGAVLLGLAIWGIVQFGFFVDTANQRHQGDVRNIQASVYPKNVGVQQSLIQQLENDIIAITDANPANASADARDACQASVKIISIPPGDQGWVKTNCLGPALSPSSRYGK